MSEIPTPHLQLQKIRQHLADILAKLDTPSDPQIVEIIGSLITSPPLGKSITKVGFWEDANGDIKYMKFYDGAQLLFTLTLSNAGDAPSETWNIARS